MKRESIRNMYGLSESVVQNVRVGTTKRLSDLVEECSPWLEERGVDLRGIAGCDLERYGSE